MDPEVICEMPTPTEKVHYGEAAYLMPDGSLVSTNLCYMGLKPDELDADTYNRTAQEYAYDVFLASLEDNHCKLLDYHEDPM